MEKRHQAKNVPAGVRRSRRWMVVLLASAGFLVLMLVVLDQMVSCRTRRLQAHISEEQLDNAALAERNAAAFQLFLENGASGSHSLDGPGLSCFIAGRYGSRIPADVGPWRIVLSDGAVVVEGVVDLQGYLKEMEFEQPSSMSGFTGQKIPFSFRGRLEADHGHGLFTVEEVALLGLPLPLDMVERVAGSAGGEKSVLIQRFALPDGISRIRIESNRMVINGDWQ